MYFNYLIFPIYLDYSSTTPVDPNIIEKFLPYFYYKFGNFSSKSHLLGWQSDHAVHIAKKKISNFLNCDFRELIWTSGSTESNNISIKGISMFYKNRGNHILSVRTAHKSILNCLDYLKNEGFNITFINIKSNGLIDLNFFKLYIKNKTILVTILYVNNEIGVIQNIKYISNFCSINKIIFHVDASQAILKIFIDLNFLKIDLLSISFHKIYGPKGIGLLYVRRKSNLYFKNIIHGGGHEKNLRSGTLPTALIVAAGEIFSNKFFFFENLKIKKIRDIFLFNILKIDSIYINGDIKYRVPHNLNISFNFIEGESLIISIFNIAISTGSACASSDLKSSHVLESLNKSNFLINSSIRFSFGRFFKISDLYFLIKILFFNILNLRNLSPYLYNF